MSGLRVYAKHKQLSKKNHTTVQEKKKTTPKTSLKHLPVAVPGSHCCLR
jgi:hypothetical protein